VIVIGHTQDLKELVEEEMLDSSYFCLTIPFDITQVFALLEEFLTKK
jgi:hypothetical protein